MIKRKLANNGANFGSSSKRAKIPAAEPIKENTIRYCLMPSLEHLSATKIVITLWSRKNIQDEIIKLCAKESENFQCKMFYSNSNKLCQQIKNKIWNMILELSDFDVMRKILSDLVNPIGQEIFDWLEYQDNHVFDMSYLLDPEDPDELKFSMIYDNVAVKYIKYLVWTSRGTIDYEETAKALLATGQLYKDEENFLACSYCFEDISLKPKLFIGTHLEAITCLITIGMSLEEISTTPYIISGMKRLDEGVMSIFWRAHLTRDFRNLNEAVRVYNILNRTDYGVYECIFWVLARKHKNNQVALKFMWSMLSDDEKSRQISSVIKYSKADLKCFFLSQMSEAQQQFIFRTESKYILLCLLDDWLWKDYFLPTMHHVWNIIPAMDFLLVVEEIVQCRMEENYEKVDAYNRYKAILKEMWRSAPKHLKKYIFEFENCSRGSGILFSLLCERNMDIIELMLPDMNEVQKVTTIFSSCRNFQKCYWLIINDQIDVVKLFIGNTLVTKSDVDRFKRKLVRSHGYDIAIYLEQNQKRYKAEEFMQWVFIAENDKREFKANLAHSKILEDILESIVVDALNEKDFEKLEDFFQWCFSGNSQKISQVKHEMHEKYFSKIIFKLIEGGRYEILQQFLNWCSSYNQRQVELIKRRFYDPHDCIQIGKLVLKLVEKDDQLESLEEFVRWCFVQKRKIVRFKKIILEASVCIELLCRAMFKLADEFVRWCCSSNHMKIRKFKKDLMLCNTVRDLFTKYRKDFKMMEKIIKWFNPSAKTIFQFREKFVHFYWLKDQDIAVLFIKNEKWDEIEQYIQLVFDSDTEKKEFKEKLAYSKICDGILESIVADDNEDGFAELENFFLWCASGNAETVVKLKVEMYEQYFTKVICKLIEEDKYQLLQQFLNWCSQNEKLQVELFKHFFYGYYKYSEIVQLVLNLVERSDQLQSLEKFVRWCFTESKDIVTFKNFILEPGFKKTVGVCIKLLSKGMLELADMFVFWCCEQSLINVGRFKNKLILHDGIKRLFKQYKHDERKSKKIVEWFNPSMEVRFRFRKKFIDLRWIWIYLPLPVSKELELTKYLSQDTERC